MNATAANKLSPNFTHRIDGDLTSSFSLTETISMMTFRAKGVLELVSINLEADHQASDEIVKAALAAAIAEIEDIDATIQAYHGAVSGGEK